MKPSRRYKTTRVFLHESAVIPGGPGTRLQPHNICAPGSQSTRQKLITTVVFTTENVINNLLSVPGWRSKCFLTRRYNLPTKARLHFPLSKPVLSIIHEMGFQFFFDPAHNTIHLPQHPSPSMHASLRVCFCTCSAAPVISKAVSPLHLISI